MERRTRQGRARILHDRAQLLSALRDHRTGKARDLSDVELAHSIASLERRIAVLEDKLKALDGA